MSEEINTLIKLITKYEVRIPIIQRDYAQGRDNQKSNEVRKNLIKDIKTCLDDASKQIDFNFVYGTVADGIFYPVDGQQRLTTLYLLHWFFACNCNKFDGFTMLKGFSYMTRNSSSEFFALLKKPDDGLMSLVKESKNLRKDIENQSWFQVEWGYDPTVDAALTFINDLSKNVDFRNKAAQYYERLENGAINFTHIEEKGDGAETKAAKSYIRMNARGKALEPFENLKAMIDSIDCKLHTALGFTKKYDNEYIDTLYSNCSGSTLEMKTKEINRKSLNYLKNIYNLNCQLNNLNSQLKRKDVIGGGAAFISEIYEYSQKNLSDEEKKFFNNYFCMTIAVFDYLKNEPDDESIKNILEDKVDFYANDNKSLVAAVLYIYYCYISTLRKKKKQLEKCNYTLTKGQLKKYNYTLRKKGKQLERYNYTLRKKQLEKYNYILDNLNIDEWSKIYLESIKKFANAVANSGDIFDYLCNTDLTDIQSTCKDVLEDIRVRIKEQKIKADIIKLNGLSWDYFNVLETQSGVRKIQYLLHISGYWGNSGDYGKLSTYINIAKTYFKSDDNDLEWRKVFAIAAHLNCNNTLKSQNEINENCGSKHIWSDEFFFWNDEDDKDLSISKPQLEKIKKAYENKANIDTLITSLLTNANYDTCWLKYAIKCNCKEALDKQLEWDKNCGIVRLKGNSNYRYDMYIMCVANGKYYGLKNLTVTAEACHRFNYNSKFGQGATEFTTGLRDYIMRLNVPISITNINDNYSKDECLYCYNEKKCSYTIYKVYSQYEFSENIYSISYEVQWQENQIQQLLTKLDELKEDDYLKIRAGQVQGWWKDGRSSTWKNAGIQIEFKGQPLCNTFKL